MLPGDAVHLDNNMPAIKSNTTSEGAIIHSIPNVEPSGLASRFLYTALGITVTLSIVIVVGMKWVIRKARCRGCGQCHLTRKRAVSAHMLEEGRGNWDWGEDAYEGRKMD